MNRLASDSNSSEHQPYRQTITQYDHTVSIAEQPEHGRGRRKANNAKEETTLDQDREFSGEEFTNSVSQQESSAAKVAGDKTKSGKGPLHPRYPSMGNLHKFQSMRGIDLARPLAGSGEVRGVVTNLPDSNQCNSNLAGILLKKPTGLSESLDQDRDTESLATRRHDGTDRKQGS